MSLAAFLFLTAAVPPSRVLDSCTGVGGLGRGVGCCRQYSSGALIADKRHSDEHGEVVDRAESRAWSGI